MRGKEEARHWRSRNFDFCIFILILTSVVLASRAIANPFFSFMSRTRAKRLVKFNTKPFMSYINYIPITRNVELLPENMSENEEENNRNVISSGLLDFTLRERGVGNSVNILGDFKGKGEENRGKKLVGLTNGNRKIYSENRTKINLPDYPFHERRKENYLYADEINEGMKNYSGDHLHNSNRLIEKAYKGIGSPFQLPIRAAEFRFPPNSGNYRTVSKNGRVKPLTLLLDIYPMSEAEGNYRQTPSHKKIVNNEIFYIPVRVNGDYVEPVESKLYSSRDIVKKMSWKRHHFPLKHRNFCVVKKG